MPTDKLIESVARDLRIKRPGMSYKISEEIARAAILATLKGIREPSTEMWRAYIRFHGFNPDEPADDLLKALVGIAAKGKWQAMIDSLIQTLESPAEPSGHPDTGKSPTRTQHAPTRD